MIIRAEQPLDHARADLSRVAKEGADPLGTTPEQFSVRIKSEIEKWGRVIKDANIKMN